MLDCFKECLIISINLWTFQKPDLSCCSFTINLFLFIYSLYSFVFLFHFSSSLFSSFIFSSTSISCFSVHLHFISCWLMPHWGRGPISPPHRGATAGRPWHQLVGWQPVRPPAQIWNACTHRCSSSVYAELLLCPLHLFMQDFWCCNFSKNFFFSKCKLFSKSELFFIILL